MTEFKNDPRFQKVEPWIAAELKKHKPTKQTRDYYYHEVRFQQGEIPVQCAVVNGEYIHSALVGHGPLTKILKIWSIEQGAFVEVNVSAPLTQLAEV